MPSLLAHNKSRIRPSIYIRSQHLKSLLTGSSHKSGSISAAEEVNESRHGAPIGLLSLPLEVRELIYKLAFEPKLVHLYGIGDRKLDDTLTEWATGDEKVPNVIGPERLLKLCHDQPFPADWTQRRLISLSDAPQRHKSQQSISQLPFTCRTMYVAVTPLQLSMSYSH